MGQPGLIKVQIGHIAVQHALDGLGVVEHAVVCGLRQRQHAGLDGLGVYTLEQGVGGDLGLDGLDRELALRNRSDDAEVIARGLEEHRNRTRHDDRVQDGFVAVAVHHHHIAGCHGVVPDDLVGGRCAIGHKVAVIGIEDARGIALGLADGTVVVQQLAQPPRHCRRRRAACSHRRTGDTSGPRGS